MAQTFQNFTPTDSTLSTVATTFQVKDCAGVDVGTPQDALKTIVINTVAVKDCNSDALLTAIQAIQANTATSNTNEALINTALNDILTQVTAVNANTDTIETSLATLIADQLTGNATLLDIKAVLDNSLLELQAINVNTDTVEALITDTNTKLDTLIAEQDKEIVYTAPTKFHIATDNFYSREKIIYDSETQTEVSRVTEYSTDGVLFTTTPPIGVPVIGWYVVPSVAPTLYNNNETIVNTGITPIVLAATTYHSVSVAILTGSATIDNNGVSFVAPVGYSNTWEGSSLLANLITITATNLTDVIIVNTIN